MNKVKISLLSHKILLVAVGVLAIGGYAFASDVTRIYQTIQNYYEAPATAQPVYDEQLYVPDLSGDLLGGSGNEANRLPQLVSSQNMRTATNTVCALRSPSATSTLTFGSAYTNYASTTATHWYIAKSASPYATTTALGDLNIIANGTGYLIASSTLASAASDLVFTPGQYFVVGVAGGVDTAKTAQYSPVGNCQAEWTILNQF